MAGDRRRSPVIQEKQKELRFSVINPQEYWNGPCRAITPIRTAARFCPFRVLLDFTVGHFVKSVPSSPTGVRAWISSMPSMAVMERLANVELRIIKSALLAKRTSCYCPALRDRGEVAP